MANNSPDRRAGKVYRQNDKGSGMSVPVPINNGPVKVYQQPILPGNGEIPKGTWRGIVTRNKPSNLA